MRVCWRHKFWRSCCADSASPQPMKSGCAADSGETTSPHLSPGPSVLSRPPVARQSAVNRDCGPPLGGHASAAYSRPTGELPASHHAPARLGKAYTQAAWSGCDKQGHRTKAETTFGARLTPGNRVLSRHGNASRSRPPCLGLFISTTLAGPETRSGPARFKHSRTRWGTTMLGPVGGGGECVAGGTTTLSSVCGGRCPGGGAAGGHHHAHSFWWWAWPVMRGGITTLATVGGGPVRGGGRASPRSHLLVVGPAREGVCRGAANFLGACALATESCPARFW